MSGNGKYTKYVPEANPKYDRLGKLFAGRGDTINPYSEFMVSGDANLCRLALLDGAAGFENNLSQGAKEMLQPTEPIRDAIIVLDFGPELNMTYVGTSAGISVPDLAEGADVVWATAGDPVNPFTPDLRSPGPGITEATSDSNMADSPPDVISRIDSLKPSYIQGAPGTGTASPTSTSVPLRSIAELGKIVPLGTSDETKVFE